MQTTSFSIPGHTTYEHRIEVPLDWDGSLAAYAAAGVAATFPRTISVFAREIVREGRENAPRMVYFQGGPGFPANRPAPIGGWINEVLDDYRLVLIDERGTGQSHALDQVTVPMVGDAVAQAAYLACFRADSIIRDAEALRRELQGDEPWAALGQSFGGFCVTSYLSLAPEGLSAAMIVAGLVSTHRHADDVYRLTWASTDRRNAEFFERYPGDEETAWRVAEHLAAGAATALESGDPRAAELLPTGEILTPGRFRMLGINLGRSYGLETLHGLLENPFVEVGGRTRLTQRFLTQVADQISYASCPMYWALHESIYAAPGLATRWSAQRIRGEFEQFELPELRGGADAERALRARGHGFRFSGEHEFDWMAQVDPALRALGEGVNALHERDDLPSLHRPDVLAGNEVPAAAWMYEPDMFVPIEISRETASEIRGLKRIEHPTFHHDGISTESKTIIDGFRRELSDVWGKRA
ncbi:pimeloyl-ACP methyl ester carboxylesterase [Arcanobacterium wilhelmae]|uniref:Pimeloyl-ACP methyl ester carboxylesterase n=1 Tax=Arcanobacterium wilhelmae TaxID=1803177 RepID=A0ABT9NAT0_9ACTO|nr:alpha/beta fold hydrolase [Arcanobacterium wilhelmae]MDP9800832.1 pimeloyl-ACP methyl ester carboxylesterase [Arcanobacterium wilhelmae]WFN90206.1 alpha/beta fold hydrolase [Arcanobacterium wilhelmae]